MSQNAHSVAVTALGTALCMSLPVVLGGCTLAKLWDFPFGECTVSADCRVLSDPSLPASCQQYACQPDGATDRNVCVLLAAEEICDGGDNDCDGRIDERSSGDPVISRPATTIRAGGVSSLSTTTSGSPEIIAWTEGGSSFVGRLDMPDDEGSGLLTAEPPAFVTHVTATRTGETLTSTTEDACYRGATDTRVSACGSEDVALATDGDHVVYAHVVTESGCTGGQLRLSVASTSTPETLYATGPERRSNSFRGVRPHPTVFPCSVNSTDACANADPSSVQSVCGLGHPALALRDGVGLLAYVSAPAARSACGNGSAVDVEAFGVYVRPQPSAAMLAPRVELTDEGSPETLGQTLAGTAPSIVEFGETGYLVAFPNENGDIAVYFVPTPPSPPLNIGTYPSGSLTERPPEVQTQPLMGIRLLGTLPGDATANGVSIALETMTGTAASVRLGVAWRSSCDAASVLRFRSADVSLDSSRHPTSLAAGAGLNLTGAGLFSFPEVQFAPAGFLTEDAPRGGVTVGSRGGGWYVAWVGQDPTQQTPNASDNEGALYLERIALIDGLPVESMGPTQLTLEGVSNHQLVAETLPGGDGRVRVTVRAASSAGVLGIPLSCQ